MTYDRNTREYCWLLARVPLSWRCFLPKPPDSRVSRGIRQNRHLKKKKKKKKLLACLLEGGDGAYRARQVEEGPGADKNPKAHRNVPKISKRAVGDVVSLPHVPTHWQTREGGAPYHMTVYYASLGRKDITVSPLLLIELTSPPNGQVLFPGGRVH